MTSGAAAAAVGCCAAPEGVPPSNGPQLDNILLHGVGERPVVKICDFGYSKDEVAGSICKTACGTPEYMAPEVPPPPGLPLPPLPLPATGLDV